MKHPSMKWFLEKAQSIIIRNLSKILQKYVWRSSFLVHLHACRLIAGNFTMKWTPSQSFFNSILSPNYAPPCIDLSPSPIKFWRAPPLPPPMFSTPVRNPGAVWDTYINFKSNQLKKFSSSKNIKIKDFLICNIS